MGWLRRLTDRPSNALVDDRRWVVLDVEASGLDAARDRLLAIAAVAVHIDDGSARIAMADSFEVVLRQPVPTTVPDRPNILLHGIGVAAQREGVEPRAAFDAFMRYVGRAPLLGFHVAFDRTLIERKCAALECPLPQNRWLDLEPLAAVLLPSVRAHALDDWMLHFGIRCLQRHHAVADALATAELLLHLWPRLRAERATTVDTAIVLAAQRRWVSG